MREKEENEVMKKKEVEKTEKVSPDKLMNWRTQNPNATLTEKELEVEKELAKLREQWVTELVHECEPEAEVRCPNCGQKAVKNGQMKRELRGKEGTIIKLERTQCKCQKCGLTFFPSG